MTTPPAVGPAGAATGPDDQSTGSGKRLVGLLRTAGGKIVVTAGGVGLAVLTAVLVAKAEGKFNPEPGPPPPLHAALEINTDRLTLGGQPVGGTYVTDKKPSDLTAPPTLRCQGRWKWAHDQGAVDAGQTLAQLTLTVTNNEPAVVQGIRAELVGPREPPLAGTTLDCPGGGGTAPVREATVDLDSRDLAVSFDPGTGGPPLPPGQPYSLQVVPGQAEVIDVIGRTETCDCRWRVLVDVTVGGRTQTLTIGPPGGFRTTGSQKATPVRWDGKAWTAPTADGGGDGSQIPQDRSPLCKTVPTRLVRQAVGTEVGKGGGSPGQTGPGASGRQALVTACTWQAAKDALIAFNVSRLLFANAQEAADEYATEKPLLFPRGSVALPGVGQQAVRETGRPGSSAALVLNGRTVVVATASSTSKGGGDLDLDLAARRLVEAAVPLLGQG